MKGHLTQLFPGLKHIEFPLSRDQLMLLMVAVNDIFLGIDIYLAHSISGTIVTREWIPILFGPASGFLLLAAGLLARKKRESALVITNLVFVSSIAVGLFSNYLQFRGQNEAILYQIGNNLAVFRT